jgi:hypothetical protein
MYVRFVPPKKQLRYRNRGGGCFFQKARIFSPVFKKWAIKDFVECLFRDPHLCVRLQTCEKTLYIAGYEAMKFYDNKYLLMICSYIFTICALK